MSENVFIAIDYDDTGYKGVEVSGPGGLKTQFATNNPSADFAAGSAYGAALAKQNRVAFMTSSSLDGFVFDVPGWRFDENDQLVPAPTPDEVEPMAKVVGRIKRKLKGEKVYETWRGKAPANRPTFNRDVARLLAEFDRPILPEHLFSHHRAWRDGLDSVRRSVIDSEGEGSANAVYWTEQLEVFDQVFADLQALAQPSAQTGDFSVIGALVSALALVNRNRRSGGGAYADLTRAANGLRSVIDKLRRESVLYDPEVMGALRFYADPISYAVTQAREPRTAVHGDDGRRARQALTVLGAVDVG